MWNDDSGGGADVDFLSVESLEEPWALYQAAIATAPVMRLPGTDVFLVTSHAAVSEAASRHADFSNMYGPVLAGRAAADPEVRAVLDSSGIPQVDTLLTADPPVHTRFRKLVNQAFSLRRVETMEAGIRAVAHRLVDGFIGAGAVDFVAGFAVPLPVEVIAGQIGMTGVGDGGGDVARVKRWSDAFTERLGGLASTARELECAHVIVDFQRRMKVELDERRARPRDDLLSDLVNAGGDGETPLTDAECLNIVQQLMVAGNETSANTLAGGLLLLLRAPDQLARVRADRTLIPNMVEELLRMTTPAAGLWRMVPRDAELCGVAIPAGSMLMLRWAAANRDPARFPDPDRLDIGRANARVHLAFGKGIHACVGSLLARRELTVAFEILLDRLDDIALAPGAAPRHAPNLLLRGLTALPITFRAKLAEPRALVAA